MMVTLMLSGLKLLGHQLARMKLDEKENIVSRFQDGFKQMWINNGNALSKLYAGTAALCSVNVKFYEDIRIINIFAGRLQVDGRSSLSCKNNSK